MKSNLLKNFDLTRAQFDALQSLFESLPNTLHFDSCSRSPESVSLIQLHWHGPEEEWALRETEAKMIARAFGGEWAREGDGTWRGRRTVEGLWIICGQQMILHGVEPGKKGRTIDLAETSAPSAASA